MAENGPAQGASASDVGKMSAERIRPNALSTHSFSDPTWTVAVAYPAVA
jgi:hypothetical protein